MELPSTVIRARFRARPNRFLVHAEHEGSILHAFCPNPGRLGEFLDPGRPMLLARRPPPATRGTAPPRKTEWDHIAFERLDRWFVTDTRVANRLFAEAFAAGDLTEFAPYAHARAEVREGKSRFDFLLSHDDHPSCFVEVKSVSLFHEEAEGLVARFPDAPTTRGARHLAELAALARGGTPTAAFFIVAAPGAIRIEPFHERDPVFAAALADAQDAGVRILARESTCDGRRITLGAPVPVRV